MASVFRPPKSTPASTSKRVSIWPPGPSNSPSGRPPGSLDDNDVPVPVKIEKAMATGRNISLPESLLAQIRNAARAEHRSVDDILADAVTRYLEDRSWTNLMSYGAEQAKALGIAESDVDRLIAESRAETRSH